MRAIASDLDAPARPGGGGLTAAAAGCMTNTPREAIMGTPVQTPKGPNVTICFAQIGPESSTNFDY